MGRGLQGLNLQPVLKGGSVQAFLPACPDTEHRGQEER